MWTTARTFCHTGKMKCNKYTCTRRCTLCIVRLVVTCTVLFCPKQLWASECGMVCKVLSLKQDKQFTINFSISNRVSFCSGSLTLFHNSDPHPISPNNNTALRLSLRAGGRGLIGPEEILAWLFPCLLEWMCTLFRLMAIITGKEFSIKYLLPRLIKWWCQWRCERKCY